MAVHRLNQFVIPGNRLVERHIIDGACIEPVARFRQPRCRIAQIHKPVFNRFWRFGFHRPPRLLAIERAFFRTADSFWTNVFSTCGFASVHKVNRFGDVVTARGTDSAFIHRDVKQVNNRLRAEFSPPSHLLPPVGS